MWLIVMHPFSFHYPDSVDMQLQIQTLSLSLSSLSVSPHSEAPWPPTLYPFHPPKPTFSISLHLLLLGNRFFSATLTTITLLREYSDARQPKFPLPKSHRRPEGIMGTGFRWCRWRRCQRESGAWSFKTGRRYCCCGLKMKSLPLRIGPLLKALIVRACSMPSSPRYISSFLFLLHLSTNYKSIIL